MTSQPGASAVCQQRQRDLTHFLPFRFSEFAGCADVNDDVPGPLKRTSPAA